MSHPQPSQLEHKIRGANRSTKAGGKLKVLPEQPELPTLRGETPKEHEGGVSTGGDSDDGDIDESNGEQDEVEARKMLYLCLRLVI